MTKKVKKPELIVKYGWLNAEKVIQYLDWRESVQDESCDEYNAGYNDGIKEKFEKLRVAIRKAHDANFPNSSNI